MPDGRHRDHASWVVPADGPAGWVYWSEPEPPPVAQSAFVSKKKPSSTQLKEAVDRIQGTGSARASDPQTSKDAAKLRTGSQKYLLLVEYAAAEDLTDEEAAIRAGLADKVGCCWWHRSSDLREDGLIEATGAVRVGRTGEERMVCAITDEGRRALA